MRFTINGVRFLNVLRLGLNSICFASSWVFSKVSSEHEIICGRLDEGRIHWTHGHNANVQFYMIGRLALLAFANFMHRSSGAVLREDVLRRLDGIDSMQETL